MTDKAILICVGYGAGIWYTAFALIKHSALIHAKSWLSARGRILESKVTHTGRHHSTNFRVRYEFYIDERIDKINTIIHITNQPDVTSRD